MTYSNARQHVAENQADEVRIGLELEFAGIDEAAAADAVARATGGEARITGPQQWEVESHAFGTFQLYLDTKFDQHVKRVAGEQGLDVLRQVVPVELVTEPFSLHLLPQFKRVTNALRQGGATGSRDGLLLGFGTHVNVEEDPDNIDRIVSRLASYVLIEDFIRHRDPIDVSRRLLPFVAPFPDSLADELSASLPGSRDDLLDLYLDHAPSRNHGLDLLPLLAMHDDARVTESAEGMSDISSRPAYHFRLPDCRIDEADWSVQHAWDVWSLVETVADDTDLLDRLRRARREWKRSSAWQRAPWFRTVTDVLSTQHGDA